MHQLPPLPDLHRHLDGSLRPSTLGALAEEDGLPLPARLRFWVGMGLSEALSCFATTLALLETPERVRRVASEICEDAENDGVTTLEIRFAPHLHRGAPPADIVDAALEGVAGRARLLLCALYGDPPSLVDELVEIARPRNGVVGIDLAGGPSPSHATELRDYAPPFQRARDLGIGRTVHASEGRPPGEIRTAITLLCAQRIGHGTTLLADPDVVRLVRDHDVVIEACPTSNLHTGVIPRLGAHPLAQWLALDIRCCVNTDNTFFSDVHASDEHRRALSIDGMDESLLLRAIEHGHAAAFRRH